MRTYLCTHAYTHSHTQPHGHPHALTRADVHTRTQPSPTLTHTLTHACTHSGTQPTGRCQRQTPGSSRGPHGSGEGQRSRGPWKRLCSRARRRPAGPRHRGPVRVWFPAPPLEGAAGRGSHLMPANPGGSSRRASLGVRPSGRPPGSRAGVWLEPSSRGAAAGRVERSPSQAGRKRPQSRGDLPWLAQAPAASAPTLGGPVSWEQMPPRGWGWQPAARTLRAWGRLRAQPLSRVRLCHPVDMPGSPVHGVLQARHCGGRLQTDCGLWLVSEPRGRGLGSWGPSSSPHLLQIHPVWSPEL